MESYLISNHFDLISPDGQCEKIELLAYNEAIATVVIKNISPAFVGFSLPKENLIFNIKSTLAQIGLHSQLLDIYFDQQHQRADVSIKLISHSTLGHHMLTFLRPGAFLGKLFAKAPHRIVRDPQYLTRMFGRCDSHGSPLLSFSSSPKSDELILEKIEGRTVAFLPLKKGTVQYDIETDGFLSTLALTLMDKKFPTRDLIKLHQVFCPNTKRTTQEGEILLVKTAPLHVRTVFAHVVDELLPKGFHHTSASILQPDTTDSGDIYEFFGTSSEEIHEIPLEFYTLEPHREYVFFEDRDQLQEQLEDPKALFHAFQTAPKPDDLQAAVFVVKGKQMEQLSEKDWIVREATMQEFPGIDHPSRQALLVEKYIKQLPSYPFLRAIENELITSQGILLTRHFPSPLLKQHLLSAPIQRALKGIYFQKPSRSHQDYFSHEDRAFLLDLAKFGIPVFWVDQQTGKVLQYVEKPKKDTGMFVPLPLVDTFRKATMFGVYGSNLIEGHFERELKKMLQGLLDICEESKHPLLCFDTPIALLTGGGPGAMEVGNRVAKELGILSCANIVDFRPKNGSPVNEQKVNPYIDAKMTYRLDRLVERQSEFFLDFPIFLMGGIGMDFEFTLEEVRRKVGSTLPTPVILFGDNDYWRDKITSRFQTNLRTKTTVGSEWVSNCFYCIQKAEQGLWVYRNYFEGKLPIGKNGPIYEEGFVSVPPMPFG